jgi:hypothetical protein
VEQLNDVFVVCCLIFLTHKFVAYVEYNWATCTVVGVGFSCVPRILHVYIEVAVGSFRFDDFSTLCWKPSSRIYVSSRGRWISVKFWMLG